MARIRVGILFGGRSAEHEVSILSARNDVAALDRERFDPVLIGVGRDGRWLLQDERRLLARGAARHRPTDAHPKPADDRWLAAEALVDLADTLIQESAADVDEPAPSRNHLRVA